MLRRKLMLVLLCLVVQGVQPATARADVGEEEATAKSNEAWGWCYVASVQKTARTEAGNTVYNKWAANNTRLADMQEDDPDKAGLVSAQAALISQFLVLGADDYAADNDLTWAIYWHNHEWSTWIQCWTYNDIAVTKGKQSAEGFTHIRNVLIGGAAEYGAAAVAQISSLDHTANELDCAIEVGIADGINQ